MTNQTMYAGQTMPRVFSDRYLAAIYCRLSKDDDQIGESASIQNQREMLLHYCKEQGWEVVYVFEDAADIIGLKRKPSKRFIFSPIFSVLPPKQLSRECNCF